jgi:hypothetical protein
MIDHEISNEWDRDIRTQGLVGVLLLLVTLGGIIYHAWADGAHTSFADAAVAGFQDGKADLHSLFNSKDSERNLPRLRRRSMFGSDFAMAWMGFAYFLLRTMRAFRPIPPRLLMTVGLTFAFALLARSIMLSDLADAEHQAVIADAMLNSINFLATTKWMLLFMDAFLCGLVLLETPLILRVGGVILASASAAGMICMAVPSGPPMPYCVLMVLSAFSGICILLLFHPQLAHMKFNKLQSNLKRKS